MKNNFLKLTFLAIYLLSCSSSNNTGQTTNKAPEDMLFRSDFDSESIKCWDTREDGSWNFTGCGGFINIGSGPNVTIVENEKRYSGTKSLKLFFSQNEDYGGAEVSIPETDHVFTRYYDYYVDNFDFAFGTKVHRIRSFNQETQRNNFDIVSSAWGRSLNSNESDMSGTNNMRFISFNYGGGPLDWGSVEGDISYERERWYCVESEVQLNDLGESNGLVRLWVDGRLVAEKTGLEIRDSSEHKLNLILFGGWYSNGAAGKNPQLHPNQTSVRYLDDVAIASSRIGCL